MFSETVKSILASPITMLVLAFVCTFSTLEFAKMTIGAVRHYSKIVIIISSVVISVGFTCIIFLSEFAVNPIAAIILATISVSVVSIITMKDKPFAYLYLTSAFIFLLSLCYSFALGLVGFGFLDIHLILAQNTDSMIFTNLYLIFPIVWISLMTFPKKTRLSNFNLVIHSDSLRSKVLFFYFLIFDLGIVITIHFVFNMIYSGGIPHEILHIFFRILLLKDIVILVSSFYVFIAICHLEYVAQKQSRSDMILKREQIIKNSSHQNKLIEYVVNTTDGRIVEGLENFLPPGADIKSTLENDIEYKKAIQSVIKNFVHPEDITAFTYIGNQDFYTDKLKHNPFYSIRFRIAPAKAADMMNFSDEVKHRLRMKKKEWIYVSSNCTVFTDEKTGNIMFYAEIDDVDDEVTRELELLAHASQDSLTKLLNRRGAGEQIRACIAKGIKSGALFMLDLDNFKTVNDEMGHPEGDKLLQETGEILKNEFRTNDIVARLGGDEFLIFAPEMANIDLIEEKAKSICKKLHRTLASPNGSKIKTSTSIGIAIFPKDGEDDEELYENADKALYEAKKSGKNKYSLINN